MTSSSKRLIASVAALQILLYHCWVPLFASGTPLGNVERFLIAATYPGVDAFFFISAYSLVSRPVDNYWGFIKNRALKIMPLFLIAWAAGRFLWFLPSIMVVYLVLPPLYAICRKKPMLSFGLLFLGWAAVTWLVLGVLRPAQDFGLFLFRIPAIILGAYAVRWKEKLRPWQALIAGTLLLAVGLFLVYRFGYLQRLAVPFRGTFYLMGIPVMLGTVLLLDRLADGRRLRVMEGFGSMTLELYFLQMMLGPFLVSLFFRLTGIRIVVNLLTLAVLIAASALLKWADDRFVRLFQPRRAGK